MATLSQSSDTISSHDHHGAPSGFVKRWLYSTNHKDIGTMYIIFAIVAAFIGGGMSIYMRMELMNPGVQYMADGHMWNVFTTAHGLIMVFFGEHREQTTRDVVQILGVARLVDANLLRE